ncbi:N-acetylmuramoyl-L-alanine amidase [Emergencia sp. 1XD21-10]|uniref:N-acetylmuramoyl-L-alanine amidase n=1 Tax=Emergencia sp. 1XD21-10 TaxID=2304569 RepID=UPI001379998C|nr:N-acetylmuramoyl-L-alanine amidase [Emergencia sp. 1XD21-10]NCE98409.1 N-acetylmuramoyl-L-alanine amidase [Emergencia sp. 1XD21-10]
MAKKPIILFLSHGHGSGADKGAVNGKFVELELAKKVTKACYDYLMKTPSDKRAWKVDYSERKVSGYTLAEQGRKIQSYQGRYRTVSVDIHFNAGGGDGAEVWVTNKSGDRKTLGTELGNSILANLKKIGQNSRGVKYSNDLYFINTPPKGVSVLVECGFVDNIVDRKGFDTDKELKSYGQAIAKALIKYAEKHE